MSVEHNPEVDIILYPANIREGLLRDQKQISVRTRIRRYADICFFMGIACAIAGVWVGPLALQLWLLGTAILVMQVAMRLYSSQRKMLTLHCNGASA